MIKDQRENVQVIDKYNYYLSSIRLISSILTRGDVYSKHAYYWIKCVSDMWQVGGFSHILRFTASV